MKGHPFYSNFQYLCKKSKPATSIVSGDLTVKVELVLDSKFCNKDPQPPDDDQRPSLHRTPYKLG